MRSLDNGKAPQKGDFMIKINLMYLGVISLLMYQVETKGPLAYLLKGCIEYILGQELTWN